MLEQKSFTLFYWKEAYLETCQTSMMKIFYENI